MVRKEVYLTTGGGKVDFDRTTSAHRSSLTIYRPEFDYTQMRRSAACWNLTFPMYAPPGNQEILFSKRKLSDDRECSPLLSGPFTHETPVKTVLRVSVVSTDII